MERQEIENQILQTCAIYADHCNDKTQDADLKKKYLASLKKTVDMVMSAQRDEK